MAPCRVKALPGAPCRCSAISQMPPKAPSDHLASRVKTPTSMIDSHKPGFGARRLNTGVLERHAVWTREACL